MTDYRARFAELAPGQIALEIRKLPVAEQAHAVAAVESHRARQKVLSELDRLARWDRIEAARQQ